MLLNSKGQEVSLPKGFATFSSSKQEAILHPLREVLVPSKGEGPMFSIEERARARLKQQQ